MDVNAVGLGIQQTLFQILAQPFDWLCDLGQVTLSLSLIFLFLFIFFLFQRGGRER